MNKIFANEKLYELRTMFREASWVNAIRLIKDKKIDYSRVQLKSHKPEETCKKYEHLFEAGGG